MEIKIDLKKTYDIIKLRFVIETLVNIGLLSRIL